MPVFTALLLGFAATPALRFLDVPHARSVRVFTLDGLRGFLALAVFFHHAALYREYTLTGLWQGAATGFFPALGQSGVAVFFMITAYLFWSRLLRERGRPGWLQLYIGRLFRIGPLYLCAVAVMLLIVLRDTGAHLHVPPFQLLKELTKWLALGLFSGGDVNGYERAWTQLAGVTWTLRFEWLFYFSLPLLAVVARFPRLHVPVALAVLVVLLAYTAFHDVATVIATPAVCALLFSIGVAVASLRYDGWWPRVSDRVASTLVVVLCATVLLVCRNAVTPVPIGLLGLAFGLIASGTTVFGLLTSRAAIRLGDASYGIYLLQGLLLGAVFFALPQRWLVALSPVEHWTLVLVAAFGLVIVAAVGHRWVERPGIIAGRHCATALSFVTAGSVNLVARLR